MKKTFFLTFLSLLLCLTLIFGGCSAPVGDGTEDDIPTPMPVPDPDDTAGTPPPADQEKPDDTPAYIDFDEEDIILTFAALSDVHNNSETKGRKMANMMKRLNENYNVDAFLFAGDLGDKINGASSKYNTAQFRTGFAELARFAERAAEGNTEDEFILWCLGNHETPTSFVSEDVTLKTEKHTYEIPAGSTMLDAAYIIFAQNDPYGIFMQETEGAPKGFRHMDVLGYDFYAVDYAYANAESITWLDEQLTAAEAEEDSRPIFVTSHMPLTHSAQPRVLTEMLAKHPSVLYLSGHTHVPMQCGSAISMKGTTAQVVLGPADHANYGVSGPGYTYCSYSMKQSAIFEIDGNGNVRVTALDLSFDVEEDGSLTKLITKKGNSAEYKIAENPLVLRTAVFSRSLLNGALVLTEDSVIGSKTDPAYRAPVLAEDAIIAKKPTALSLELSIGKAEATNLIKYYTIEVTDEDGNPVNVYDPLGKRMINILKIGSDYIMHGNWENYPDTYNYTLYFGNLNFPSELEARKTYTVSVTAYDDFGVASNVSSTIFSIAEN